jgi:hypothetical protein
MCICKEAYILSGYLISEAGVATCPDKVKAMMEWPQPTNTKELRSFLGLAGYYMKFIKHFSIIARPLTDLLKKHSMFVWTDDHDQAFKVLMSALVQAPVLVLPDFSQPFCIETDALDDGVGVVLMQNHHPIAFISKALGPNLKGLSTYEKEYVAIVLAVDQWRSYLQLEKFHIYTDQKCLIHLNEQRLHTSWQQKIFTKLLGLSYKIIYKKGADNNATDALSRRSQGAGSCFAILVSTPKWLEKVSASYEQGEFTQTIIAKLSLDQDAVPHFSWNNGLLWYKKRIWAGSDLELQLQLIAVVHGSTIGGHSSFPVTYQRMKQLFAWTDMRTAVHDYVQSCVVCQQERPDRVKSPGLLQPVAIPDAAWQTVSMDFVEGLPQSDHANCIMVVIDKFTKYGHFYP